MRPLLAGSRGRMKTALCLLTLAGLCSAAWSALPDTFLEGALLGSATLEGGLEVGVYGPRLAGEGEPAVLGVVLAGSESVTITSGLVMLAWPRGDVSRTDVPAPAGFYTPFGQWSPDFDSETRQLLCLNTDTQWATRLMALAPLEYEGGPGEALDAVVLRQPWTYPPEGTPFRTPGESGQMGIAFIADETVRQPLDLPTAVHGAHRVLLTLPLVFKDPASALSLWLACTVNGHQVTHQLTVSLTPREQVEAPPPAVEMPTLTDPAEGAEVSGVVTVSGKAATPGALVVAWLEEQGAQAAPAGEPPILPRRYISRRDGVFRFELPLPATLKPGDALTLHVRTEAPGYKSPESVRNLVVVKALETDGIASP